MKQNTNSEIDTINLRTISPDGFERICRSFIINVAHRTGLDLDACKDVYQNIMTDLFMNDSFRHFNPSKRLTPYLATITRRMAHDVFTKTGRCFATDPNDLERVCDEAYSSSSGIDRMEQTEYARELVYRGLEILRRKVRTPKQVEALVLCELEEMSPEEAAQRIGESVGYIRVACHRCRKKLAEIVRCLIYEE